MKDLLPLFQSTAGELETLVASCSSEELNLRPVPGGWTAGQVARHLLKSNAGFAALLEGPAEKTERAPDALAEQIRHDFLDFETKNSSPAPVQPEDIRYDRDRLLRSLESAHEKLGSAIRTLDGTETCRLFDIPYYGYLTRREAVVFVIYHMKRHIHQLRRTREQVRAAAGHVKE